MKYFLLLLFLPVVILSDPCVDNSSNCNQTISLCNDPNFKQTMEKYCALTCNFCTPITETTSIPLTTTTTSGPCRDIAPDCNKKLYACNITINKPLMEKYCALSCHFCTPTTETTLIPLTTLTPSSSCSDIDPYCYKKLKLCNNTDYKPIMEKYCALSCNFCTPTSTEGPYLPCVMGICPAGYSCIEDLCIPSAISTTPVYNCTDSSPNCDQFKNLCKSPGYIPMMKKMCAKTCGYCESGPILTTTNIPTTTLPPLGPCISGLCPYGYQCINNLCYPIPYTEAPQLITTTSTCIDSVTNCKQLKDYCSNPEFKNVMEKECPKTCGYCS